MRTTLLFLCLITASVSIAQNNQPKPCTAPQATQFDFWLGEWNLTWNDTLHGTNKIEKVLGDCTVQENFYDPNTKYTGKSWSVYNPRTAKWHQTWVDDRGGYIALTGGMEGDKMVLKTGELQTPNGKQINRMVFYNIKPDSFNWIWEASTDGGTSWKPAWQITYVRKK
jgi:hypothetical protein